MKRVPSSISIGGQRAQEWLSFLGDKRSFFYRLLQIAIIVTIFGFLFHTLYANWNEVRAYDWKVNYPILAVSFLFTLVSASFYVYPLKLVLSRLGAPLTYRKTFRLFFMSQLARYIPGMVWGVLSWAYLAEREEGVRKTTSTTALTVHLLFQVVSGVVVFVLTIPFWQNAIDLAGLMPVVLLLPLGLLLLQPALVNRGFNFALRLAGEQPLNVRWGYRYVLMQLGLWIVGWLGRGLASLLLINSIASCAPSKLPIVTGIFAIAWVIGFVTILTPSGLGVMEGSLTLLLSFHFPVYVAVVVALLTRLMRTIADIVCAVIAWRL